MPKVIFQSTLRRQFGVPSLIIKCETCTLEELLITCERILQQSLRDTIIHATPSTCQSVVLLNGRNVMLLHGLKTQITPEDEVIIFPPAGGG